MLDQGQEYENEVAAVVQNSLPDFQAGSCKIYRNIILRYRNPLMLPNCQSPEDLMTAEVDIIVVTPYLIFVGEVKSGKYIEMDWDAPTWLTSNKEESSNPMFQNRLHKNILCEQLGVKREQVITFEVLKTLYSPSPYPVYDPGKRANDYVFSHNNLSNIGYLFSTETHELLEYDRICRYLDDCQARSTDELLSKHIEKTNEVLRRQKKLLKADPQFRLRWTDSIVCPLCHGELRVEGGRWKTNKDGKRKTEHYFIACENFRGDEPGSCHFAKYDNYSTLQKNFISIEDRLGWGRELNIKTDMIEFIEQEEAKKKAAQQKAEQERRYVAPEPYSPPMYINHYEEDVKQLNVIEEFLNTVIELCWSIYKMPFCYKFLCLVGIFILYLMTHSAI